MADILPEPAQLWIFLTASLALGLTPGPDMILVIARSLGLGFRAGVISMLGISLGGVVHIVACAFGISLILIEVPALYDAIRWLGAAYLAWMAVTLIRDARAVEMGSDVDGDASPASDKALFVRALMTNLMNPKVALFMVAFLPQFVPADAANPATRIIVLGAIFIAMGVAIMTLAGACFARLKPWLARRPLVFRLQSGLTGALMMGFAVALALDGGRR